MIPALIWSHLNSMEPSKEKWCYAVVVTLTFRLWSTFWGCRWNFWSISQTPFSGAPGPSQTEREHRNIFLFYNLGGGGGDECTHNVCLRLRYSLCDSGTGISLWHCWLCPGALLWHWLCLCWKPMASEDFSTVTQHPGCVTDICTARMNWLLKHGQRVIWTFPNNNDCIFTAVWSI